MTPTEVRKQIKAGKTEPLYLLESDDLQSRHDLAIEFANVNPGSQVFQMQLGVRPSVSVYEATPS